MEKLKLKDIETGPVPQITSGDPLYFVAQNQRPSQNLDRTWVALKGDPRGYRTLRYATEVAYYMMDRGIVKMDEIIRVDEKGWTVYEIPPRDRIDSYPDAGSW